MFDPDQSAVFWHNISCSVVWKPPPYMISMLTLSVYVAGNQHHSLQRDLQLQL